MASMYAGRKFRIDTRKKNVGIDLSLGRMLLLAIGNINNQWNNRRPTLFSQLRRNQSAFFIHLSDISVWLCLLYGGWYCVW